MFRLARNVCVVRQQTCQTLTVPALALSSGAKLRVLESENRVTMQQHISLDDSPPDGVLGKTGVRLISLYQPENRNVLSIDLMKRLIFSIRLDDDDPNLRCIVLWAKGKIFSAGHDLKELNETAGVKTQSEVFRTSEELMNAIIDCPVPVIAKVDGLAAAAGCQLVAQCDLAIASEKSTFSTPGANVGIFCSTPGVALSRTISNKNALGMLLTGESITAQEAYRIGLINKVVPSDNLDAELEKTISAIISKSREVLTLGKRFFYKQMEMPLRQAYHIGGRVMVHNLGLHDGKEGIRSFLEKRKPNWKHSVTPQDSDNNDPYYDDYMGKDGKSKHVKRDVS